MQPQSVTLLPGCRQQFAEPAAAVWIISPSLGTIDAGLYTAPDRIWLSRTVAVTALDNGGLQIGQATVTISSARSWMTLLGIFWAVLSSGLLFGVIAYWPPPARPASVSVYPLVATLRTGESLQFLSSTTGAGDTAVTWSATDGGITPSGVFSAPATLKTDPITVTATRNSDHTQTASAQVLMATAQLILDRSVVDASGMKDGETVPFHAAGPAGGAKGLQWYLSGPGEIDVSNGTYTLRAKSGAQAVVTAVDPATGRKAAATVILSSTSVIGDASMLFLVVLMGAFGAMLAAVRSFVNFVGSRSFVPSWSFYYLFRPMFGSGLALIVFFAYRIGAVSGPKDGSPADPFTAAFVAGMVGLFADTVLQKLKELIEQLFRPQDTRSDKLPSQGAVSSAPSITKLTVANGVLTIEGAGFAPGAAVSLNGQGATATFVDSTKLTVTLPAALAGQISVIVTNSDGKSSAAGTFTAPAPNAPG